MEDYLIFLSMENKLNNNLKNNATWNIKNQNNGCGTAPGNLVRVRNRSKRRFRWIFSLFLKIVKDDDSEAISKFK